MARCVHFEVQVGWAPSMPTGSSDELATGTIGWDLVRGRLNRVDFEFTVVVDYPSTTQVPFWNTRRELGVEPVTVGVPEFNARIFERCTVSRTDLAREIHRCARLVLTHWDGTVPWQLWRVFDVVGTFNGTLVAFTVGGGDFFDRVFQPHIKE